MHQKYKFFIKDCAVTFSKSGFSAKGGNEACEPVKTLDELRSAARVLTRSELEADLCFNVADDLPLAEELFSVAPVVVAAGGFVLNPTGHLLMIHRRGFWDLPKGKIEKGETLEETAVREVEEECGISGLSIVSEPFETYHLYEERGVTSIKRSVWYEMRCDSDRTPHPQLEEDITQAIWADLELVDALKPQAYRSIQDVIGHFLKGGTSSVTSGG